MLKIQHLTKRFGTAPLFTDLCMEVDTPVVLWAPSGWGKTTLLRILMGLERPTTGSVEGVGRVAAVFQEDRLCPQLNAVQNVTLVLPVIGVTLPFYSAGGSSVLMLYICVGLVLSVYSHNTKSLFG